MSGADTTPGHGWDDLPPGPPPEAAELAELLSTAVRIEPELMRAVRFALLPQADVGAESDLWFSAWTASRNPRAMVLLPDVQRVLRARLADRLARCAADDPLRHLGRLIEGLHGHLSPLMRLEEEVTWRLALGGHNALADAEAALRSALRALVEDEGRQGVADWLVGAWRRLPESLLDTVTGWQFRSIAACLDTGTGIDRRGPAGLTCADAAMVVDAVAASGEGAVPEVEIPVRMHRGVLSVGGAAGDEPDTMLIRAPGTEPVVLELRPGTTGQDSEVLLVHSGRRETRTGCSPSARLVNAGSDVYDPSGTAHGLFGTHGRPERQDPTAPARPTVLIGRRPDTAGFPQWVYDNLCELLHGAGYQVLDIRALQSLPTEAGDISWPDTFHAAVMLLDPVEIRSPMVREQIALVVSWCAGSEGPPPLLLALDGVSTTGAEAQLISHWGKHSWLRDTDTRVWRADFPRGRWHARDVARMAAQSVHRAVARSAAAPSGPRRVPTRAQILSRTVAQRLTRYADRGDVVALGRALALLQAASPALRPDHPEDAALLVQYARALCYRARATDSVDDAEHGVQILRGVLAATTTGGAQREGRTRRLALHGLLRALHVRLVVGGEHTPEGTGGKAFDEALALGREALDADQPTADRAELVACLAPLAADVTWLREKPEHAEWASRLNLEAALDERSIGPVERVAAARNAARSGVRAGRASLALQGFKRLFDQLERLDWVGMGDAQFTLVADGFAGMPENAAACAVAAGELMEAVELLERGLCLHRVILAGRALREGDAGSCQPRRQRLYRLRRETARLAPRLAEDDLRAATVDGPVVVLNVAALRSDALILTGDSVSVVELPGMEAPSVRRGPEFQESEMREALRPAMEELARRLPGAERGIAPWVWWCPTGPLSDLPVHEAYPPQRVETGAEPAPGPAPVSSYAPGLAGLLRHRRPGAGRPARRPSRALVVVGNAGDETWWARSAEEEVAVLRGTGMEFDVLGGRSATRLAVLEALSEVEVVHLVCRLVRSPAPVQRVEGTSAPGAVGDMGVALALADGPLSASDIAAADLSHTELVFLSGYGGAVGSGTEPDRDTLAGSLHFAGCRHVVTSLSTSGPDRLTTASGSLAAKVYRLLLDQDHRLQPDRVPWALHQVMAEARGSEGERFGRGGRPLPSLVHLGS
ncbi:CHAT domain-containing protein [Streptomyces sp. NPDC006208]|uniref:CHAT domain-containing protein n=1 Tax=Streptomyces sp. NPDC006208 TaxID=3156734 RepID=UPI0033B69901